MNSIQLYKKYILIHLKTMMQHRTSFFLTSVAQFLTSFNIFLGIHFMMHRFKEVKGFSYGEVLLCFSITLMAYTMAECIFRSLDTFETIIGNGEFDRILLKPRGSLFLVLCSKIELTRFGRLLQAVILLFYGLYSSAIHWNPIRAASVVLMIIGGVAVFAAIYLMFASLCFFTLEGLEFMNIFTNGAVEYGKYPIGIYGKTLLTICTYFIPFALFQYYPFLYLTGRTSHSWYALLPLAACLFLIPAGLLWNFGLSRYQSTGS